MTALLRSTETGVAAVRALVLADLVESRPAFVNFNAYLLRPSGCTSSTAATTRGRSPGN